MMAAVPTDVMVRMKSRRPLLWADRADVFCAITLGPVKPDASGRLAAAATATQRRGVKETIVLVGRLSDIDRAMKRR